MLIDSAARLRGFERDLGLKGQEFPTILSILYVGYIIMQIPSSVLSISLYKKLMMVKILYRNMFLNWMGKPSLYLPTCMIIWGMISCLTGKWHMKNHDVWWLMIIHRGNS